MEFKKLIAGDFYRESDFLNGDYFKEGKYTLLFPNGVIRDYDVKIETTMGKQQVDMTLYPDSFPIYRAYIEDEFLGAPIKIYLRESQIEILTE